MVWRNIDTRTLTLTPEEVVLGFSLKIANAPPEAVLWNANFAEKSFDYDPIADSGWLGIDESWNYPSDPRGVTTLHIWILDAENNVLLDVHNLGPVNDGVDYIFDCATGRLEEVVPPPPGEWVKLDTRTITLIPPEVPPPAEWVKLDTRTITLIPPEVPPPPEVKKFPWMPVLIGAGALIATVGLAAAKKR